MWKTFSCQQLQCYFQNASADLLGVTAGNENSWSTHGSKSRSLKGVALGSLGTQPPAPRNCNRSSSPSNLCHLGDLLLLLTDMHAATGGVPLGSNNGSQPLAGETLGLKCWECQPKSRQTGINKQWPIVALVKLLTWIVIKWDQQDIVTEQRLQVPCTKNMGSLKKTWWKTARWPTCWLVLGSLGSLIFMGCPSTLQASHRKLFTFSPSNKSLTTRQSQVWSAYVSLEEQEAYGEVPIAKMLPTGSSRRDVRRFIILNNNSHAPRSTYFNHHQAALAIVNFYELRVLVGTSKLNHCVISKYFLPGLSPTRQVLSSLVSFLLIFFFSFSLSFLGGAAKQPPLLGRPQ